MLTVALAERRCPLREGRQEGAPKSAMSRGLLLDTGTGYRPQLKRCTSTRAGEGRCSRRTWNGTGCKYGTLTWSENTRHTRCTHSVEHIARVKGKHSGACGSSRPGIVLLAEKTKRKLGGEGHNPWSRSIHARHDRDVEVHAARAALAGAEHMHVRTGEEVGLY